MNQWLMFSFPESKVPEPGKGCQILTAAARPLQSPSHLAEARLLFFQSQINHADSFSLIGQFPQGLSLFPKVQKPTVLETHMTVSRNSVGKKYV